MAKITLAQALTLKKRLNAEIGTLCNERNSASRYIKYEVEEDGNTVFRDQQMPERDVNKISEEVDAKRTALIKVQTLIDKENATFVTEWMDENKKKLTISELWMVNENIKGELANAMSLASYTQKTISKGSKQAVIGKEGKAEFLKHPDTIVEAPFDVKTMQERAKRLEKLFIATGNALQKANWSATITIEDDLVPEEFKVQ